MNRYRKATFDDLRDIYSLICDMEETLLPVDSFAEIFKKQVGDEHHYILLCEIDGSTVGFINLRYEEQLHHAAEIAEIMEFVVHKDYRNRGIGGAMLEQACSLARDRGCIQIEVACNQLRHDTHRFYEREGMKNFHFKFSMNLTGAEDPENKIGR